MKKNVAVAPKEIDRVEAAYRATREAAIRVQNGSLPSYCEALKGTFVKALKAEKRWTA